VLALQQGQQLVAEQAARVLEVQTHGVRERLVALGDDVVQVPHRDDLAQLQLLAAVHQQLQHDLEGRALALQHRGHGHQGMHQGRAEGIDLAEHPAVRGAGEQGVQHVLARREQLLEGRV
jgi:hypothetical protein